MRQKSRRGLIQYKENPFIKNSIVNTKLKIRRMLNKRGDMMITSKETGEIITPIAGFWHAEQVDNTKFVKLYINGVKAFKELSGAGTKVFELLYLAIQKGIGKDIIWLSFTEIDQTMTPMAKATFMRGMRELIEKGFIAESITQNKYFINPDYVWNGDRLTFVKEYYKSKPIKFNEEVEVISSDQNNK